MPKKSPLSYKYNPALSVMENADVTHESITHIS